MSLKKLIPTALPTPFARYSHGVVIEAGSRTLVCSGQLGIGLDAVVPESAGMQAALCFDHIGALLSAAGMTPADVVRVNAFVTDRVHLADYMAARDEFFRAVDSPPASTLLIVSGFSREAFKVEVEVLAAADGEPHD